MIWGDSENDPESHDGFTEGLSVAELRKLGEPMFKAGI